MRKITLFILLFFCFEMNNIVIAQLADADREELIKVSNRILKPNFSYQYNVFSNFVKQNIKERKGSFFIALNPKDTLEWKKKLKNDTSDAPICFNLYLLYKSINKFSSAKFYLHKSLYLYNEKLRYNPVDTVAALRLAVLHSSNNDFEGAKSAYQILAKESNNKELPYMMLSMMHMTDIDSMNYYINELDHRTPDDYKKMFLYTLLKSLQFAINYNESDSVAYKTKNYKELSDWKKGDAIYEKNKENFKYELMYNAMRTYAIILQSTIVSESILIRYEPELVEMEKYYLEFIKDKKYKNKTIPYLSLSAIYTVQKKYDKALVIHKTLYEHIKKYEITDSKESDDILSSYVGLFELAKKYKEGAAFTKTLVDSNVYNVNYRKAYIYYLYKSENIVEVPNQTSKLSFYDPTDIYPQLVDTYEAIKKHEYDKALEFLKAAYAKNPSEPEIFAFMAVLNIIDGNKADANKYLSNIEGQMPETVKDIRKYIK